MFQGSSQPAETESEQKNPSKQSLSFTSLNGTGNSTKYTPTPVILIGDELIRGDASNKRVENMHIKQDGITLTDAAGLVTPLALESLSWQPIDYLENSNTNTLDGTQNKRENSRAFGCCATKKVYMGRHAADIKSLKLQCLRECDV